MSHVFRSIASTFLLVIIFIVALFSENSAQMWFPAKDELGGISARSVWIINIILFVVLGAIIYFVIQLFTPPRIS